MNPTRTPTPERPSLDEGDVVADFRLIAPLPRDHAHTVWSTWRAVDLMLGRPVALKLLQRDHVDLAACRAAEAELRRGVWVPHPGLARRYGLREDDEWVAVAEALIDDARRVDEVAAEAPPADALRRTVTLFAKAAEALAVAHNVGVAHGLLSRGNLLVTVDGLPKLSDVGLQRLVERGLRVQRVLVSAHASPEQWLDARNGRWHASPAADQFALASLLQQMLDGHHPYAAEDGLGRGRDALVRPRRRLAGAPALDAVLARALEPDPRDRFEDLASLADDLRAVLDGQPPRSSPPGLAGRLRRAARRWSRRLPGGA